MRCLLSLAFYLLLFIIWLYAHSNSVDLSGLDSDEEVIGLDYRPANGRLYLVTSMNRIYDVENPSTGTATIVSTITGCTLSGATFGVDFNPVVDRLRIVSSMQRFRCGGGRKIFFLREIFFFFLYASLNYSL